MTTVTHPSRIIDLARPRTLTDGHVKLALDNPTGRPIHVRALDPRTRNGLACDCTCFGCGEPLVARQGSTLTWHFAHRSSTTCPAAGETALHLAAKMVLKTTRKMALPHYTIGHRYETMVAPEQWIRSNVREVIPAEVPVTYDRVDLEQAFTTEVAVLDNHGRWEPHQPYRIVADAVGTTIDGKRHFLEMVVTHALDARKEQVLHALGIPTLEVHLDHLREHEDSPDLLDRVQEHLEGLTHRYWVVPPISIPERTAIERKLYLQNIAMVEQQVEAWKMANR